MDAEASSVAPLAADAMEVRAPEAGRTITRWLLAAGMAGPLLFVVVFLIAGATRAGYDPMRTFISQLSLGPDGWQQIASFLVSGALIALSALGFRRAMTVGPGCRWAPIVVGIVGIGLIVSGVFVTDPGLGYPPGTPPGLGQSTSFHGAIHLVGATLVFGGMTVLALIFARRFRWEGRRAWAWTSAAVGVLIIVVWLGASGAVSAGEPAAAFAGLLQRIAAIAGLGWIALLSIDLVRA